MTYTSLVNEKNIYNRDKACPWYTVYALFLCAYYRAKAAPTLDFSLQAVENNFQNV